MRRDDAVRIRHKNDAAESARNFVVGRRRSDLDTDEMLRFALVRAIEIIGEAASKVSLETRAGYPTIPWAAIVSMRNRLVHAYFAVDHDVLWKTVDEELPALMASLPTIAPDL